MHDCDERSPIYHIGDRTVITSKDGRYCDSAMKHWLIGDRRRQNKSGTAEWCEGADLPIVIEAAHNI